MKNLCLILSIVFLISATGCSVRKSGVVTDNSGYDKEYAVTEKPLTLTVHMNYWDGKRVYNDQWIIQKEVSRLTNVFLKGTASESSTDSKQAFALMMTSNTLPDIIHGDKEDISRYAAEGAFLSLDDLIEQHAPNIRKFIADNPWYRKESMSGDGKMYMLPYAFEPSPSIGYFVRQDWLDNLNMKVPETLGEFENMLRAFLEKDPNQNGKKDEVPFFARSKTLTELEYLFGGRHTWYAEDEKVYFGPAMPEFKKAISNLSKWYAEGLIDKEIFTRNNSRDTLLANDAGGATVDWFASTAQYNDKLQENIPGFSFLPIAPIADVNGKVWVNHARPMINKHGWGISMDNKHPVETIKYFDFYFSDKGRRLNNFGLEGVHHTIENGSPVFLEKLLFSDVSTSDLMYKDGAFLEVGTQLMMESEFQWMNPIGKQGYELYLENKYYKEQFPTLALTNEEIKKVSSSLNAITTYVTEMRQKWIMGNEDVNQGFEQYLANLENFGLSQVVEIYNNAYKRYLQQ